MKNELAIVIPAYKSEFLRDALKSIADQTCHNFTLYIGNDASPYDLDSIIYPFKAKLDIIYEKFQENLGGENLINHWNRCINMVQEESWIWLFSDDDILDPYCVELFYQALQEHPDEDVFHFNVQIINEDDKYVTKVTRFPEVLYSSDFFYKRLKKELFSFVVEYIFRKETFLNAGGFEKFDLAWAADDATWIKLSKDKGIKTIYGALVKWRLSGKNISSITDNKAILIRKLNAHTNFLLWAKTFFKANNISDKVNPIIKIRWMLTLLIQTSSLSIQEKIRFILQNLKILEFNNFKLEALSLLFLGEVKKIIKNKFS